MIVIPTTLIAASSLSKNSPSPLLLFSRSLLQHSFFPLIISFRMQTFREEKQEKMRDIKGKRVIDLVQICLRTAALGSSVAATWVMFTSSQTTLVFGIQMDAKYSYASAFKFFAFANAVASVFALISLSLTLILMRHGLEGSRNMFFFIHDLVMMSLVLAGCSAATAIGYVGQYGNSHAGWMPICDHFQSFCHRITAAVVLGFMSLFFFLCLTIISATKSTYWNSITPVQVQDL